MVYCCGLSSFLIEEDSPPLLVKMLIVLSAWMLRSCLS